VERTPFISIEGPDFTGKTDILEAAAAMALSKGIPAYFTKDPSPEERWMKIKQDILETNEGAMAHAARAFLFLSGRLHEFSRNIKPRLDSGIPVVVDRFFDSWISYQTVMLGREIGSRERAFEMLLGVNQLLLAHDLLREPTVTILLQDTPTRIMDRIEQRRTARQPISFYEVHDVQAEVLEIFRLLHAKDPGRFRVHRIDALDLTSTIEKIARDIVDLVSVHGPSRQNMNP
jgi:dTMP kinase